MKEPEDECGSSHVSTCIEIDKGRFIDSKIDDKDKHSGNVKASSMDVVVMVEDNEKIKHY